MASALPTAGLVSAPPASASKTLRPLIDLFRKQPYLIYQGDPTSMQVLWQLTATDSATMQWGADSTCSGGSARTAEYGTDHQHTLTIAGLAPAQHCYYRVTVQGVSYGGSFNAAPAASATHVKFLAYGDTRSDPATHDQAAAGMIAAWNADPAYRSFALAVGDLVSSGDNEADWTSQFFSPLYSHIREFMAQVPFQSCMGNHEGTGLLFVKYFPYPFVGGRFWSYDYGPAHVVVVDQYSSYLPGSPQLLWIASDLAATTKPWKFICLHEPGWSAGGDHGNNLSVQSYLQPLCVQYGVSIVFGGHNHYYARAVVDGVHHITTGGGGAPLYVPDPSYPSIVAAAMVNHFCTVDIDGRALHFRALQPDGALVDSFSVRQPIAVAVNETTPAVKFGIRRIAPNPLGRGTSRIEFELVHAGRTRLDIFDAAGKRLCTLVDADLAPGARTVTWDGREQHGQALPAGVYFAQLRSNGQAAMRKIMLTR